MDGFQAYPISSVYGVVKAAERIAGCAISYLRAIRENRVAMLAHINSLVSQMAQSVACAVDRYRDVNGKLASVVVTGMLSVFALRQDG